MDSQHDQEVNETEDRELDPRSLREREDRRLKWAQVAASTADAVAKLADVAVRLFR